METDFFPQTFSDVLVIKHIQYTYNRKEQHESMTEAVLKGRADLVNVTKSISWGKAFSPAVSCRRLDAGSTGEEQGHPAGLLALRPQGGWRVSWLKGSRATVDAQESPGGAAEMAAGGNPVLR